MGLRIWRHFGIAPGLTLNLRKRGASVSIGERGARVTLNTRGDLTETVGLPNSGVYWTERQRLLSQAVAAAANGVVTLIVTLAALFAVTAMLAH
jgi:hypothetical protein